MAKIFVWNFGTGSWFTPGDWYDQTDNIQPSQTIPGSGDTVLVATNTGTITAGANAATAATAGLVQFLNSAADYTLAGFLDVTELDVFTPLTITGTVSATASVYALSVMTINGTLSGGAAVSVDASRNPYAQIIAQNGAQVTVSSLNVGITTNGEVTVTGSGTSWTTTATTAIGLLPASGPGAGVGTLNITAGATYTGNGQALVGNPLGTSGTVTVSGGAQWTVGNILGIGAQGTGTVTADGGTITAQGQLQEGNGSGGNATLTIQNGGSVSAAGIFIGLGAGANATLRVSGAAGHLSSSAEMIVGVSGTGTVTDTGGRITVTGITQLGTGASGSGTIAVSGGGTVAVAGTDLATVANATGTITVDGTGSTFTDSSNLYVGAGGTGVMTVSNGGSISASNLYVGISQTGTGALTLQSAAATSANLVQVGAAGTVTLNSGTLGSPSVQIAASGKITGAGTVNGAVVNNGTLDAEGGTLIVTGAVTGGGTGSADIVGSGATLELQSAVSTAQTIRFSDATGTVIELAPTTVHATYSNFVAGDVIDLENITVLDTQFQNGVLTLYGMNNAVVASLNFGSVAGTVGATLGTGTASTPIRVTLTPCFAEGTRIDTPTGPVAVERIRVGDHVRTLSGGTRKVVWVGHREVELTGECVSDRALPVLFARDAFGPGVPSADVVLSPDHAVFWGGVLIPARLLVNGSTVRRVRPPRIAYWHIELDRHDVVLAEGLPAETYLDTGDRAQFAGLPVVPRVDEAARRRDADGCAEWVVTGPLLDSARVWLAEQAGGARRAA